MSFFNQKNADDLKVIPDEFGVTVASSKDLLAQLAKLRLDDKVDSDFAKKVEQQRDLQFTYVLYMIIVFVLRRHCHYAFCCREVLRHIDKLSKGIVEKTVSSNEPRKIEIIDRNSIQFNVSLSPSQRIKLTSRITDLEQKLEKLESLVGSDNNHAVGTSISLS